MRRAKIVCTLGPATSGERMDALIAAGMNIARLNMSHGDYTEHGERLAEVRRAAEAAGRPIAVFADLQGPKIRLGRFESGPVVLVNGATFTITVDDILGDVNRCSTTFKGLPGDVSPGEAILIDDGRIELRATMVTETDVVCEVVVGGPVSNNKGINLPGVAVSVPALSDKDEDDLRWALRQGVDMIALSFVRSGKDVVAVHKIMDEEGRRVPVIAKIEKPQAVDNLDDIIDAFDAFMVARGDLGVELPLEDVPLVQKQIIRAARKWAKPVIVATQMLESMISAPRPTRAEASDVANAVLDGADAVMLSGETSVGAYPIETVSVMSRIIAAVEEHGFASINEIEWDPHTTGGVVAMAAAEVANRVGARYLVAFSKSGDTARRLSRLRSEIPVLCFTPSRQTQQELSLAWGVTTYITKEHMDFHELIEEVDVILATEKLCERRDRLVVVYGSPMGISGKTNALQVHRHYPRDGWDES
ncbi:MAG: pyruvate kinase [Propionibacteriaceae bacterium]